MMLHPEVNAPERNLHCIALPERGFYHVSWLAAVSAGSQPIA